MVAVRYIIALSGVRSTLHSIKILGPWTGRQSITLKQAIVHTFDQFRVARSVGGNLSTSKPHKHTGRTCKLQGERFQTVRSQNPFAVR